jgi:cell division protein FtsW
LEKTDKLLLYPFLALILLGSLMVFSAGINIKAGSGFLSLFMKHMLILGIGFGLFFIGVFLPLDTWQKLIYPLIFITLLLLVLVLFPGISPTIKGAKRWLKLPFGFSFQPSFLCKWVLVMYMAISLSRKSPEKLKSFKKGLLPYLFILFVLGLLFLGEPDFGGFFVVCAMSFIMLLIAGTRLIYWIAMALIASPFIAYIAIYKEYRLNRLLAFMDVWKYAQSYSYQVVQSMYSFAAGGIKGVGLGLGRQKLAFLPEAHTDFIFSVIGEELGFLGTLFVVICFAIITIRGFYIALKHSENNYFCFLTCGLTLFISFEALVNMCVSISLAPPKGLPLPFLSYGGTAMIIYMLCMGILMNLSRRATA